MYSLVKSNSQNPNFNFTITPALQTPFLYGMDWIRITVLIGKFDVIPMSKIRNPKSEFCNHFGSSIPALLLF